MKITLCSSSSSNDNHPPASSALEAIVSSCPSLLELNLWLAASAVTDDLVVQLAAGCSSLERVDLFACTNITDKAVSALATSCSWLTHLNVSNSGVTGAGIVALRKGCPGLVELIVEGCDVSESPAIDELRAAGCRVYCSIMVRGVGLVFARVRQTGGAVGKRGILVFSSFGYYLDYVLCRFPMWSSCYCVYTSRITPDENHSQRIL